MQHDEQTLRRQPTSTPWNPVFLYIGFHVQHTLQLVTYNELTRSCQRSNYGRLRRAGPNGGAENAGVEYDTIRYDSRV